MERIEISRRSVVVGTAAMGTVAALSTAGATGASAASAATLRIGSRGAAVTTLQKRLNALGYWCGTADGVFGAQTAQAAMAIQKVAGLGRDGIVGPATQGALSRGVRPGARKGGDRIEIDKGRQILLVVRGGQVKYIFNTSTGSGEWFYYHGRRIRATTPSGDFKIYTSYTAGWQYGSLGGLYKPFYFNGGIAVHGAGSIPGYPASHGCCRLSTTAQNFLISGRHLYKGEAVSVY